MMANQQNSNIKRRLWYLGAIIVLIALGLLSRRIRFIPDAFGDALWAMVVYCCFRILLIRRKRITAAAAALLTSFAVEFSQLLNPDWLVKLRSTFIGHMLLGQGFLWTDLIAYTVGIACIYCITVFISVCRKRSAEKITPEQAKAVMDRGEDCIILDVREFSEYEAGHIPGAVQLSVFKVKKQAGELLPDRDRLILVYCKSGVRSAAAGRQLLELGYRNVKDFGGLMNWPYELTKEQQGL